MNNFVKSVFISILAVGVGNQVLTAEPQESWVTSPGTNNPASQYPQFVLHISGQTLEFSHKVNPEGIPIYNQTTNPSGRIMPLVGSSGFQSRGDKTINPFPSQIILQGSGGTMTLRLNAYGQYE